MPLTPPERVRAIKPTPGAASLDDASDYLSATLTVPAGLTLAQCVRELTAVRARLKALDNAAACAQRNARKTKALKTAVQYGRDNRTRYRLVLVGATQPTRRRSFDSKAFKAARPDLYEQARVWKPRIDAAGLIHPPDVPDDRLYHLDPETDLTLRKTMFLMSDIAAAREEPAAQEKALKSRLMQWGSAAIAAQLWDGTAVTTPDGWRYGVRTIAFDSSLVKVIDPGLYDEFTIETEVAGRAGSYKLVEYNENDVDPEDEIDEIDGD